MSSLLALLRCPETGQQLSLENGDLVSAAGRFYPIKRGVPRFVSSESYSSHFGRQWTRFRRTQHDTAGDSSSEANFRQLTGWTPGMLKDRTVLDAGCGAGRYLDVAARWGASVVGLDLSCAVDTARQNLELDAAARSGDSESRALVVQGSVSKPPLAPGSFDFVFSLGVLHHCPDPSASVLELARLLRPGGELAIWLYHGYNPLVDAASSGWRRVTTRLPWPVLSAGCWLLSKSPFYWFGRYPIFRWLTWLVPVSLEEDPRRRWLDTVDWYGPTHQSKHRYPEVENWLRQAGLVDLRSREPAVTWTGRRSAT